MNELKNILEENNIKTELLIQDKTRLTTVKTRMIGQSNSQLLRLDVEDATLISDEISDKMIELYEKNIEKFDIIIISDYKKDLTNKEAQEFTKDVLNYMRDCIMKK